MLNEIEVKRPASKSAGYTFTAFMWEYVKIYIYRQIPSYLFRPNFMVLSMNNIKCPKRYTLNVI